MARKKSKPNKWPEAMHALRQKRKWTQEQAAKAIGVSLRTWTIFQSGERIPSDATQVALLYHLFK